MADLLPIDRLAGFAGPGVVLPGATQPPVPSAPAPQAVAANAGAIDIDGLYAQVLQLIALVSAQLLSTATATAPTATTPVAGGGAMAAPLGGVPDAVTGSASLGAQEILGGMASSMPVAASIVGGGGSGGAGWSIVGPSIPAVMAQATAAAPASTTPPVAGGGGATAAPQVDLARLVGVPQAGGLVATVLAGAQPTAGAARSEGVWTVLSDGAGAQLQAHVHGPWSSHPTRVQEGIQRGFVQVHLHTDGTLHLHDVV
ncbi:MAG: hypothetical protein JWO69_141 [Thermoleophilia bacterium]|jgi:hypothetical protein|nr:hypothetical protein [Thermoleophilia bacterium]